MEHLVMLRIICINYVQYASFCIVMHLYAFLTSKSKDQYDVGMSSKMKKQHWQC